MIKCIECQKADACVVVHGACLYCRKCALKMGMDVRNIYE